MKKTFLFLSTVVLSAACVLSSCSKDEPNKGGLKEEEKEDDKLPESLKGSSYVVINLDDASFNHIASKVAQDLRVDDVTRHLYVWDGTYAGGTCAGVNFYGEAAEWTSLVVTNIGWSGAGWFNDKETPAIASDAADLANWKFHVAYKGAAGKAHIINLYWNGGTYKFAIGEGSLDDAGASYSAIAPISGKFVANDWNEYEVALTDTGMDYTKAGKSDNIVGVLSGGVQGTTIDLDAMFFYKK